MKTNLTSFISIRCVRYNLWITWKLIKILSSSDFICGTEHLLVQFEILICIRSPM
jgi:hypothetical protein